MKNPSLEHILIHSLITAMRLHHVRLHKRLEEIGVYPGQPMLLFALYEQDGRNPHSLAQALHIRPATATVMINRLEKNGLVEKRPDDTDLRKTRVYLTARGKNLKQQLENVFSAIVEETFLGFSHGEKKAFLKLAQKMQANLEMR